MKTYVIKSIKNIKSFLFLFLFLISGTFSSILPTSLGFSFFKTSPLLFNIALMPLFVDLITNVSFSIALNMLFEKFWLFETVCSNRFFLTYENVL